jgi:hypothetical protein
MSAGMSVCAELGLGFGTDGDVDFKGELAGNGTSVVAEAKGASARSPGSSAPSSRRAAA